MVEDEGLKKDFQKCCDAVLADGLDLEQVDEDDDLEFLIRSDVKRGVARNFIRDISGWAQRYNQTCIVESYVNLTGRLCWPSGLFICQPCVQSNR